MEVAEVELEHSEEYPIFGLSWQKSLVLNYLIPVGLLCLFMGLLNGSRTSALLFAIAVALGPYIGAVILLIHHLRRTTMAFSREGIIVNTGFFAKRRTVVPWNQLEGVSRWRPGPYREASSEWGISMDLKPGAIPKRRDPSIKLICNREETQRILDAMEKYSGRDFEL